MKNKHPDFKNIYSFLGIICLVSALMGSYFGTYYRSHDNANEIMKLEKYVTENIRDLQKIHTQLIIDMHNNKR